MVFVLVGETGNKSLETFLPTDEAFVWKESEEDGFFWRIYWRNSTTKNLILTYPAVIGKHKLIALIIFFVCLWKKLYFQCMC
jgi:hypothetical protein